MTPQVEPIEGPDDRPGYMVRTDYHIAFVDGLKEIVPSADREWWSAPTRAWWIAEEHLEDVVVLLHEVFGEYDLIDTETGEIVRGGL